MLSSYEWVVTDNKRNWTEIEIINSNLIFKVVECQHLDSTEG